jgi:signal transduction histidine kinase/ligand-binding sensor domain-containing protein
MPGASRTALALPRLISLALFASLLLVRPAAAQVYRFDRVTAASGLPNDAVFGLFQDSRGYLWIATENGVCRHDGVGCTRLGVREGLVAPVSRDVLEDREGRIWIATEGGLSRWDGHAFVNFTKATGLPDEQVYCGTLARDGSLWFGTTSALLRWDGQRFQAWGHEQGLPAGRIWKLAFDASGALWLALRGGGLARFRDGRFESWGTAEGLPDASVFGLAPDASGGVWVGTSGGLAHFDGQRFRVYSREQGLSSEFTGAVLVDRQGRIWFTTFGGGLGRLEPDGAGGHRLASFTRKSGLPDDFLTTLLEDREGSLWCGTRSSGAARLVSEAFASFTTGSGLVDGKVTGLGQTPDGTLWFASLGGLASQAPDGTLRRHGPADGLPEGPLWSLHVDRSGALWMGGSRALFRFDGRRFESFPHAALRVHDRLTAIAEGADGTLWFGSYTATGSGLLRRDAQGFHRLGAADGLPGDEINGLTVDREGRLWIATFGGLVLLEKGAFTRFGTAQGLPSSNVSGVLETRDGRLFVGTDEGLCQFEGGRCRRVLTTADGLASNTVRTLFERGGRLWAATVGGLCEQDSERFRCATPRDGLVGDDFSLGVALQARDGSLWLGTNEAAVRYRDAGGRTASVPPRVHLVGLQAGEDELAWPPPPLQPGQDSFVARVDGISFRDAGSLRFRVRLLGLEDDWAPPSAERRVRYAKVPAGDYRLQVQAAGRDGVWSETAEVPLRVLPHLWQTTWVRVLALLGALGLLRVGYRLRVRGLLARQQRELRQQRERHEQRLLALRELLESVRVVNSRLDATSVLESIAEEGARLIGGEPGGIGLVEDGQVVFRRLFVEGRWEDASLTLPLGEGVAGQVAATATSAVVNDPGQAPAQARLRETYYLHGWMDVPIVSRDGAVVGVLEVRRKPGGAAFDDGDRQLVESLGAQAAVAIENTRLYRELDARNRELHEKSELLAQSMRELARLYHREQQAGRDLQALDRMKSDFMILASHEMRTPLTVLKGYSDAWLDGMFGTPDPAQRAALDACARMLDRMTASFNQIVESLRLGEGRTALHPAMLDLASGLRQVVADLQPFAARRGQTIHVEAPARCDLLGDPSKLELVLANLVQNAIKFTPDGGRITIQLLEEPESAHLVVEDSGVGVDPEEAERIFQRFYAAPDTYRHSSGSFAFLARGLGLGLAIARGFVEGHGGRIWCESAGPGQGSAFHVLLPREPLPELHSERVH